MMRIKHFVLIVLSSALLLAGQAQANDYVRSGMYAGLNAAYGIDLFGDDVRGLVGVPAQVGVGNSWGLNARVGGRLWSWIALEAQYEWMDSLPVEFSGVQIGSFEPHTITANLKLYIPIRRVQPYILAGFGGSFWDLQILPGAGVPNQSDSGFAGRLGAGLDLYITENVALNVEGAGVLTTNTFDFSALGTPQSLSGLYYFSVSGGLLYRF